VNSNYTKIHGETIKKLHLVISKVSFMARKKRSWVSIVWSPRTVQTWRRQENVDPSGESLYWRQLSCPSVYGYEHTNWQFTNNIHSANVSLNYASIYERRQCKRYCELTPQTWQVNWMQIQPVRTELGDWLLYRPGCTHAMLQECLRARLHSCNGGFGSKQERISLLVNIN